MSANVYLPGVIAIPSSLTIIAATQENPMVITVSVNDETESNTYVAGQCIVLNVPYTYGMFQANKRTAIIQSVDDDEITLDIDSSNFDTFVIPSTGQQQPATIAPNGSRNLQYNNNTNNVGFKSLDNRGN